LAVAPERVSGGVGAKLLDYAWEEVSGRKNGGNFLMFGKVLSEPQEKGG
jgi:hypothetical protein